jgi:hypothetical protein
MRMRWLILVAVGVGVLWATALLARADGLYYEEALGPGATVSNEMASRFESGGLNGRIRLGKHFGPWAIEGGLGITALSGTGDSADTRYSGLSYGVAARYDFPWGENLALYVRGGLIGMAISRDASGADRGDLSSYGGRGWEYGAGVKLHGRVSILGLFCPYLLLIPQVRKIWPVQMGLFIERMHSFVRLQRSGSPSLDGDLGMTSIGFSIGSSF